MGFTPKIIFLPTVICPTIDMLASANLPHFNHSHFTPTLRLHMRFMPMYVDVRMNLMTFKYQYCRATLCESWPSLHPECNPIYFGDRWSCFPTILTTYFLQLSIF